ncbi:MAG TPA: CinA family nicotinamide mononucleotide deamidase-related protein [Anaerolineae bacterium]|nr:CinA family nicotinamide mononucleotide deamidase-related protein [Anaerolineae bacterium]
MHAEIIATGSELLLGEVTDTNSTYIARKLREIGLNLFYKTVVGDNEQRMEEALRIALNRSDVIITTGGLGPTVDDVTRPAVARAVNRELIFSAELLAQIQDRFRAYGSPMGAPIGENNRRQAYLPQDAIPIENPVGTAPCFIVEYHDHLIISLPGVPREMEYLIDHVVLPFLKDKLHLTDVILIRTLHTVGLGESRIDEAIGDLETSANPTVGLSAKAGQVDIRVTSKAATRAEAEVLNAAMEQRVRKKLDQFIFGVDEDTLESVVTRLLNNQHLTLASVECGTGGMLGGRLAQLGEAFRGGITVADGTLSNLDAVAEAAHHIRADRGSDFGLCASVIPALEQRGLKLMIALVTPDDVKTNERGYGGHSALAQQWASTAALGMVWRRMRDEG